MKPCSITNVARIAYVVGPSSGAAKAMAEFHRRVAGGASPNDLAIYRNGRSWLVGPPLTKDSDNDR